MIYSQDNPFVRSAFSKASKILSQRKRMAGLIHHLFIKLNKIDNLSSTVKSFKSRIHIMARLVSAFVRGEYRNVALKTIVSCVAAIVYFVNPMDLIPDFVPITGLLDDLSVLIWVYNSFDLEIEKFVRWESSKLSL